MPQFFACSIYMPTPRLDPEVHRKIRELHKQGLTDKQIVATLKVAGGTVSNYKRKPLPKGDPGEPDGKPTNTEQSVITGDSWSISLPKTRICTLDELVSYCKVDLSIWEVERYVCNKWESAAKVGDSDSLRLQVEPLFQIKAFLKKKKHVLAAKREIEELRELAKRISKAPPPIKRPKHPSGNLLEINIPDAHIGKLAWGVETGGPNYDTNIAIETYVRAFDELMARTSGYDIDEIWMVIGNDILNSDDAEGRTTKGTPVSTDGRYHRSFKLLRTAIAECIRKARARAMVKVIFVPGNHDQLSVWHLGDSIECLFHNVSDVEIDNEPRYYKYHQFGSVMLMFTHGDKGKRGEYPLMMATERPEMFGATKFREAHTGHTHQTKLDETHGVRVRVLPALCPADDWHAENGLVGNLRNAEAYVWNREEGLIGIAIYSEDARKQ